MNRNGSKSSDRLDCIVIGAGPAGAMTARELARRERRVLLVERATMPRYKVCGCCLNPRAIDALDRADLAGLPAALGAQRLGQLVVASDGRQAAVRWPLGVALSRERLDEALGNAATVAGASYAPATLAVPHGRDANGDWLVELRNEAGTTVVQAPYLVLASGLNAPPGMPGHVASVTAPDSRLGAGVIVAGPGDAYAPGSIYMACGQSGYVGLTRLEDGRLDMAAALDPDAVRQAGRIGPLASQIIESAGLPRVPGLDQAAWKGTPLLTRQTPCLAADGVFRVGDAAGYVEPFTGEGMAWAIAGGCVLGALLGDGLEQGIRELEQRWTHAFAQTVKRRQTACRLIARGLRRPWLTHAAVRLLNRVPGLAAPVLSSLHRC